MKKSTALILCLSVVHFSLVGTFGMGPKVKNQFHLANPTPRENIRELSPARDVFSQIDVIDPIVITGSQIAEPLSGAPVRTEVIEGKYLNMTNARSLAEAVEGSPGVRVETSCSNCNQQSIQMLGLPQQYIGLLFDGLPTFSTLAGVYGIEQIPVHTIGQVEVVKGGGSVLYGPGAVSGVINVIPREPVKTGGSLDTDFRVSSGDSFDTTPGGNIFGLYDFVSDDEESKTSFYVGYDRIQPVDLNNDRFTDISERELLTAGFRTTWSPSDDHILSFDVLYSDEDRRGGEIGLAFNAPANQSLIAEEIFSDRKVATLKWLADWDQNWNSRLAYSNSHTERASYYGGTVALGSPDLTSSFYDSTWNADRGYGETGDVLQIIDGMVNYELDEQNLFTFGSSFETETLKDKQPAVNRSINESFDNLGFIAQHRWKPIEAWTLEYGIRGDFNSEINDPIFSPRAAILWSSDQDVRVRGVVSTGFRAPEVFDEDLHISSVGGDLQTTFNDPNLKEEKSVTVSLSPEWQITDEWRVELNTFHTWLADTFIVEPNDDPITTTVSEFARSNGESSQVYGTELNFGYFTDNWKLELSWVQQRLKYEKAQLILGDPSGADPNDNAIYSDSYVRTPESLGLIRFSYQGERFDSYFTGKLTGPMHVPRVNSNPNSGNLESNELKESPWFFTIDIGTSHTFEVGDDYLIFSLGIKNLIDAYQDDLDSGSFRDGNYIYGPAFPRSIYAGLRYEF